MKSIAKFWLCFVSVVSLFLGGWFSHVWYLVDPVQSIQTGWVIACIVTGFTVFISLIFLAPGED